MLTLKNTVKESPPPALPLPPYTFCSLPTILLGSFALEVPMHPLQDGTAWRGRTLAWVPYL